MRSLLSAAAWLLFGLAVLLVGYGLNVMFDNSYSARIVGGDAYNYIIYATRGTAFVVAGAASAIGACFLALVSRPFHCMKA